MSRAVRSQSSRKRAPGSRQRRLAELRERADEALGKTRPPRVPQPAGGQDVDPQGWRYELNWDPAPGATAVELDPAPLGLAPAVREESLGVVPHSLAGGQLELTLPGLRRVRSLALTGLRDDADAPLAQQDDLGARRLIVSLPRPGGGWDAPMFAVPPVARAGMVPRQLVGASFANGILQLPDVLTERLRVSLVEGSEPKAFSALPLLVDEVSVAVANTPADLELRDFADAPFWGFPGTLPPHAPPVAVDLRHALQRGLEAALAAGEAPSSAVTLRAAHAGGMHLTPPAPRGALLRLLPEASLHELAGAPVPFVQPDPPIAPPDEARADLRVRYLGLRLLAELSDPPRSTQPSGQVLAGVIVRDEPLRRPLAHGELLGRRLARVGLIGRALQPCELTLSLVHARGVRAGEPLGPAAVLALEPDPLVRTRWLELAPQAAIEGPVALSLRTSGPRFLWAEGAAGPAVRLAVHDPDPAGRPLHLGTRLLTQVTEEQLLLPGLDLGNAFAGPLEFHSELFLRVELSRLTLRYAR